MAHEAAPEWARSILASVTGIDAKLSSFQVEITASVTEMRSDYGQLAARMNILEASMEQYQSSEDVMADISAEAERQVRMQKLESMVQKLESQINDTKAIFEFNSASAASDFLSNFQKIEGELQFPDPKGGHFVLKVRRDLKVKDRRLFLAMGKLRQKLEALLNGRFTVGSNGLGGDVYILRGEEDPVQCAHVTVLEGVNDVQVEFTDSTLTEFGILADKASLMDAAQELGLTTEFPALRQYARAVQLRAAITCPAFAQVKARLEAATSTERIRNGMEETFRLQGVKILRGWLQEPRAGHEIQAEKRESSSGVVTDAFEQVCDMETGDALSEDVGRSASLKVALTQAAAEPTMKQVLFELSDQVPNLAAFLFMPTGDLSPPPLAAAQDALGRGPFVAGLVFLIFSGVTETGLGPPGCSSRGSAPPRWAGGVAGAAGPRPEAPAQGPHAAGGPPAGGAGAPAGELRGGLDRLLEALLPPLGELQQTLEASKHVPVGSVSDIGAWLAPGAPRAGSPRQKKKREIGGRPPRPGPGQRARLPPRRRPRGEAAARARRGAVRGATSPAARRPTTPPTLRTGVLWGQQKSIVR
ncbi:unnamed protein product [Prorocentrum cordatum]|uniref:Uncharacterized protein n=1 Tax=Prorocentrum cordatum TaxID=2364126 RepID=A0ABN9UQN3_9DINO|nr:unnamed protein product [Polarella glacialis]